MPKNEILGHVNKVIQKNWNYAKTPLIVSRQTISTDQSITRHQKSRDYVRNGNWAGINNNTANPLAIIQYLYK